MSSLERKLLEDFASYEAQGLRRRLRPVERLSARECVVEGRRCLDFSSNDYLGLSFRPELKEGARRWLELHGSGSGASRLISGSSPACLALEEKIAAWKGFERSLILGSGYSANVGVVQALSSRGDAVFADKLNHASLNSGCLLSQAEFKRYRHLDFNHLEALLSASGLPEGRLIVSDSVFSMDGDLAPLEALKSLAEKYDAFLFIDDAHASGVLGEKGHGLASQANCDLAMSTFSKALGSYGACVSASKDICEYLISKCGPFIYSTALPPSILGAIDAAVDLVQSPEADEMRASLDSVAERLRKGLLQLGFDASASKTPIVPIAIGDSLKCLEVSKRLLERGVFAPPVRPPTVPRGTARLRVSLNACHSPADVDLLLDALASCR